jgi:hypothetical protein
MALFYEMLNQVQKHDTGRRNLFLKNQINIKNSKKSAVLLNMADQFG